jgi:hypothetical protein
MGLGGYGGGQVAATESKVFRICRSCMLYFVFNRLFLFLSGLEIIFALVGRLHSPDGEDDICLLAAINSRKERLVCLVICFRIRSIYLAAGQ